jgi:hypothetical protein|nr:MAG TPA: hypothetical protein [Caudoviricetes sp.]
MKKKASTQTSTSSSSPQYRLETVKREGLFVVSWDGRGFCVEIGDHNIDDLFDLAKKSIKKDLLSKKSGKDLECRKKNSPAEKE